MKKEELLKIKKMLLMLSLSTSITMTGCKNNLRINDSKVDLIVNNEKKIDLSSKKINKIHIKKYDDKYGFLKKNKDNLKKFDRVKILKKVNSKYLIKSNSLKYFVNKDNISVLPEKYIDIDISSQKLVLFNKNNKKLNTSIVSGSKINNTETPIGFYSIYSKEVNKTLKGDNYSSFVNRWMPFYEGYGIHDATWRNKFGDKIYKTNGSHGCVNLPLEEASNLYDKVDVGTKVLIHR